MPGVIPFHIIGTVAKVPEGAGIAYAKVQNGNVYYLYPHTPGLDFSKLKVGQIIELEVTNEVTRVFSARILD
jgi:hypothetical protein